MSSDSHGSRGPLFNQDAELAKRIREMNAKALGEFPSGKLNEQDEGSLAFAVGTQDGKVVINFPKPVAWLAMPPEQAAQLAMLLIKHARAAGGNKPLVVQVGG